ncbi:Sensor protein fixL [hydrothermal vent metagenome]|uniref:Sensor protein fixL n=1 Tax=hydrothermal vent metagenome TaxID=652676 RepID=A0A1W1E6K4_9ZZZZ
MKFNDLDLSNWRDLEINTDSLWVIRQRDKSGKHKNIYHGNFIPQIPNQLIQRYTKQGETVFEPFMGSGTALFECETLGRKYIGIDINPVMIDYVNGKMQESNADFKISECNALDAQKVDEVVDKKVQFVLMHPPYMDIVKFTDKKEDLSACGNIHDFIQQFKIVCENSLKYLEKNRYFAIVIGDVYKNSEVLPLGFYCMDMIKRNFKVKLKGTIIKNIEGNRGKLGTGGIWRYRALNSDYYIFKHEYIFVFKKEF